MRKDYSEYQIIEDLLDTDYYKLTMLHAIWKNGHNKLTKIKFNSRGDQKFTKVMFDQIRYQINKFRELKFTYQNLADLENLGDFEPEFLEYLRTYDLSTAAKPWVSFNAPNGRIDIEIVGNWQEVILYEVPILAIVNEVYFGNIENNWVWNGNGRLGDKIEYYNSMNSFQDDLTIFEFGTRRRHSREWQNKVVNTMNERANGWFKGTSNVALALEIGCKPIGTMAHEYLQAYQVIAPNLADHLMVALADWTKVYGDKLAVALTDSITSEVFIESTRYIPAFWDKLTGFRHDSGCPIEWGNKITQTPEYNNQTLIFSDGLNPEEVFKIWRYFGDRFPIAFGVGTDFTNDVGMKALNIVMKMIEYDGQPVCKISDEPGKQIGANAKKVKEYFNV